MLSVITHPDGVAVGAGSEEAQRWIPGDRDEVDRVVTRSKAMTAMERLAIYGNSYYARLIECIGDVYPVLKRTLGDEIFDGFAFGYLQDYPSQTYTLNLLGDRFVEYLQKSRPEEDGGWADFLIDLAQLEWEIYEIFDGPGVEKEPPFEFPLLEEANDPLALKIEMPPCFRLLEFSFPVNQHYTAVRQTEGELELPLPEANPHFVALSRRDFIVRRYPLSRGQFVLLQALRNGQTLGEALERCLEFQDESSFESALPDWFRHWSAERCFFTNILPNS